MAHIDERGYAILDDDQSEMNASGGRSKDGSIRTFTKIVAIAITTIVMIGIVLLVFHTSASSEQPQTQLPAMQFGETTHQEPRPSTTQPAVTAPPITAPLVTVPLSSAAPETTHDSKISSIRSWYYTFTDHMDDCRKSVMREGWTAYWYEGDVVAVNFRSAVGPDGSYSESWYYHDGELYFIYLRGANGDNRVLRLYFWDGKLIRWIEEDGEIHNTENEFYADYYEDGMVYYREARSAG